jgi:hypothetical protein
MGNIFSQQGLGSMLQAQLSEREKQALNRQLLQTQIDAQRAKSAQYTDPNYLKSQQPSAVQEYQFYQGLTPEEQQRYLSVKRSTPEEALMRKGVTIDPVTGQAMPLSGYGDTLGRIGAAEVRGMAPAEADAASMKKRSELQAQIDMNPNIIKAEMEARGDISPTEKKQNAKQRVTTNLLNISNAYDELQQEGGAISYKQPILENLGASARSTETGQRIGRALGTKEQAVRDKINTMRPSLINDIRQASEMGAKGMDSEKELAFFLQAVSDPTRDLETNRAALAALDQAYGLGAGLRANPTIINKLKEEFKSTNNETQNKNDAPVKGKVVDGYLFLGGDPNNQSNYRKVK